MNTVQPAETQLPQPNLPGKFFAGDLAINTLLFVLLAGLVSTCLHLLTRQPKHPKI